MKNKNKTDRKRKMCITYIKIYLQYLTVFELGWVSSEELLRSRRVLSDVCPHQITTSQNDKAKIFLQLYLHKFIFDSACLSASLGETCEGFFWVCKYSPNSRCRLLSCLLALLGMFLANSSPVYSSWNEWKFIFCHFVFTTKTSQPCPRSSRLIIQ